MTFRGICAVAAGIFFLSAMVEPAIPPARAQTPAQWEGKRVVTVRVIDPSGKVLQSDPAGLPLQPGQTFSAQAERDSLRQLFRTGQYADLTAEITPAEDGVRLDFAVELTYYVGTVAISGLPEPPTASAALSALRLNLGEPFRESEMSSALDRLRQTLEDEGLYQAKLSYTLSPKPENQQMNIAILVQAGERARAGVITLVDDTPFREQELRSRLGGLKADTPITSEKINQSIDRCSQLAGGSRLPRRPRHHCSRHLRSPDEPRADGSSYAGRAGYSSCNRRSHHLLRNSPETPADLRRGPRSMTICCRKAVAICAIICRVKAILTLKWTTPRREISPRPIRSRKPWRHRRILRLLLTA